MADRKGCCCGGDVKTVLACSGGSNVGQMTNKAAVRPFPPDGEKELCEDKDEKRECS